MIFRLPADEYDDDFIQGLILAVNMKLLQPKEIEDMFFKEKLTAFEAATKCLSTIKSRIARKKRK